MTNEERLQRADRIMRRQNAGLISKADASAEFDRLLDEGTGDLHFHGDTSMLRDVWGGSDIMVFPHRDAVFPPAHLAEQHKNLKAGDITERSGVPAEKFPPSNTGMFTQGRHRGRVVLKPGENETNAHPEYLAQFGQPKPFPVN